MTWFSGVMWRGGLVEDRRSVAEVSDGESRRKLVLKA